MASSTPIIYNNLPNYRRVLSTHNVGLCVDTSDIETFANALEALAHDPKRRIAMGYRGRELFLKQFNWQHQENLLLNLYNG